MLRALLRWMVGSGRETRFDLFRFGPLSVWQVRESRRGRDFAALSTGH